MCAIPSSRSSVRWRVTRRVRASIRHSAATLGGQANLVLITASVITALGVVLTSKLYAKSLAARI